MSEKKLKLRPITEFDSETPFEKDLLDRTNCGKDLTKLIECSEAPFVLALDAPWGNGKSWFLHHWGKDLEGSGFKVIRFNAWKNDISDSPLVGLISETSAQLETRGKKNGTIRKMKKHGAAFLKASIPIGIKILTSGVIDLSKAIPADIEKAIQGEIGKSVSKAIDSAFSDHEAAKESLRSFKETLEELSSQDSKRMSVEGENEGDEEEVINRPLVFLVDELDRCRPSYAISFLEVAKHFFDAPGIVFVIAVDYSQLGSAIGSVYGSDFDRDGYLRRFFDLRYRFPQSSLSKFISMELKLVGLGEVHSLDNVRKYFEVLFSQFEMDLRSQQRCIARFAVGTRSANFIRADNDRQRIFQVLLVLQEWNEQIYQRFIAGKLLPDEFFKLIGDRPESPIQKCNVAGALDGAMSVRACLYKTGIGISDEFKVALNKLREAPNAETIDHIKETLNKVEGHKIASGQYKEFVNFVVELLNFTYRFQ